MPTIDENVTAWNDAYDWAAGGAEWSYGWGGTDAQWYGCLFPRLRRYLPAETVVEIAPGHGRWTAYLAQHCKRLVGVDISSACVDVCRQRFAGVRALEFHVNDGTSLSMVDDGSADLVFSFDSLVHAEVDVIDGYLREIARVLTPDGRAVLHHSNAGALVDHFAGWDTMSPAEVREAELSGARQPSHWRAMSVSAEVVRTLATEAGLHCVGQELINWGGDLLIDCVSVLGPATAASSDGPNVVENPDFSAEMRSIRRTTEVYL